MYFLYYMVSETITNTLTQRQNTLFDALLVELSDQVLVLNGLVHEVHSSLVNYNTIFLTVFNKLFFKLQVILVEVNNNSKKLLQNSNIFNYFTTLNFNFQSIAEESNLLASYQNIITSDLILVESQSELLLSTSTNF